MITAGLSFRELLDYSGTENERWRRWFVRHAELFDLPYAEAPLATVRQLVRHIAFVEHRYAAILDGRTPPDARGSDSDDVDTVFSYVDEGRRAFELAVDAATTTELDRIIEFVTLTAGARRASARKMIAHAIVHGVRHWAQLATVLREQGHRTDWPHDLLMSEALT